MDPRTPVPGCPVALVSNRPLPASAGAAVPRGRWEAPASVAGMGSRDAAARPGGTGERPDGPEPAAHRIQVSAKDAGFGEPGALAGQAPAPVRLVRRRLVRRRLVRRRLVRRCLMRRRVDRRVRHKTGGGAGGWRHLARGLPSFLPDIDHLICDTDGGHEAEKPRKRQTDYFGLLHRSTMSVPFWMDNRRTDTVLTSMYGHVRPRLARRRAR